MKFLVEIKPSIKVTNFEDELVDKDKTGTHVTPSIKSYKQRVLDYLAENNDSAVIWKIKNIVPITEKDIDTAFARDWKDFEDAVQYTVAESNGVNCIITRNKGDFEENVIPCYSPQEFLEKYRKGI